MCTDGAPSTIKSKSGFKAYVKNYAPHVSFTYCLIHHYILAMKILTFGFREVFADVVKIVNHICGNIMLSKIFQLLCEEMGAKFMVLSFHAELRWLLCDRVLNRLLELGEEVAIFL